MSKVHSSRLITYLVDSKIKAIMYLSQNIDGIAEQYGEDSDNYNDFLFTLSVLAEDLKPYREFIVTTIPEYAKVYDELLAFKEGFKPCKCQSCLNRRTWPAELEIIEHKDLYKDLDERIKEFKSLGMKYIYYLDDKYLQKMADIVQELKPVKVEVFNKYPQYEELFNKIATVYIDCQYYKEQAEQQLEQLDEIIHEIDFGIE